MADDFESAAKEKRRGVVGEIFAWLAATKKYWLVPLVVVLLLLALVVILAGAPAGVFFYTLF